MPVIPAAPLGDHSVRLRKSADQSVSTSGALITWNTEDWDTDSFHNTSSNTSRVTIPTGQAGKYRVSLAVTLDNCSQGNNIGIKLYKNGATALTNWFVPTKATNNSWHAFRFDAEISLAENDYIEIFIIHDYASGRNVVSNDSGVPVSWLDVRRTA